MRKIFVILSFFISINSFAQKVGVITDISKTTGLIDNAVTGQISWYNGTIWDTIPHSKLYWDNLTDTLRGNFSGVASGGADSAIFATQYYVNSQGFLVFGDTVLKLATKADIAAIPLTDTTSINNRLNAKLDTNAVLPMSTNPMYSVIVDSLGGWRFDTIYDFSTINHRHLHADSLTVNDFVSIGGVQTYTHTELYPTSTGILLPASKSGWCRVQLGNDLAFADFRFDSNGVIKSIYSSGSVAFTNSTEYLNIYDAGTQVAILQKQGTDQTITITAILK